MHQLFLRKWNSQNQLSLLLLSQKQKQTKRKWESLYQNLLRKTLHSKLKLMKKLDKLLFQEWENFTLKSS